MPTPRHVRRSPSEVWYVALLAHLGVVSCLFSLRAAENPKTIEDDPFAATIRPTGPLTPEDEQKSFRLPEGFRIELYAAEPEIQKPMNLAFDARGRLWMSGSTEYPFAAADGKGRDAIKILEDSDADGRADTRSARSSP